MIRASTPVAQAQVQSFATRSSQLYSYRLQNSNTADHQAHWLLLLIVEKKIIRMANQGRGSAILAGVYFNAKLASAIS